MPSLTLLCADNLVSAWVPDDVIAMSFKTFFYYSEASIIFSTAGVKKVYFERKKT